MTNEMQFMPNGDRCLWDANGNARVMRGDYSANDNAPITELARVLKWHTFTYKLKVDAMIRESEEHEAQILHELTTVGRA